MSAYLIVSYDVADQQAYEAYVPGVIPLLQKHGGEVLAADYDVKSLEGQASQVNVVIRFDSEKAAMGFYNDPEYAPVRQIRLDSTSNGVMMLAKEFVMPGN